MDEEQKRARRVWPMIFIGAFVFGALLWGFWMAKFIRQTRENRQNTFFVPSATQPTPPNTNAVK